MSSGRVAIVTGGSAGIGRSIVQHLLDAGWGVVSMARRAPDITHPRLHAIEVDLGDVAATREAVKAERELLAVVPKKHRIAWSHWLIEHGRAICRMRMPASIG